MAIVNQTDPHPTRTANGSSEIERLGSLVSDLQQENTRLRQSLLKVESERDRYREAFLDHARAAREFEDLDIPTLESMSAGPVEMIE